MTVVKYYTMDHLVDVPAEGSFTASGDEIELMKSFVLCSDATYENGQGTGDPTEIALVVLGDRYNRTKKSMSAEHKRVSEKPFDSDRKLMSTLNQEGSGFRVHVKGAIDNLLKISTSALVGGKIVPLTEEIKADYLRVTTEMSDDALRVLGAAFKDTDTLLTPGRNGRGPDCSGARRDD